MIQGSKFIRSLVVNGSVDNINTAYGLFLVCDFRANVIHVVNKTAQPIQIGYGVLGQEKNGPVIPYETGEQIQVIPFLIDPGQRIFLKSLGTAVTTNVTLTMDFYG